MSVKYGCKAFDWKGDINWSYDVREVVLTDSTIAIDWTEGVDWHGHLHGSTADGLHFQGRYSYKESRTEGGNFSLTRFLGGQEILLFGTYHSDDDKYVGDWLFHLTPR